MIRATIVIAVLVVGCGDDFHPTKWTDDPYARPPTHADPQEPVLSVDGGSTAITTCHPKLPLQGYATPEADVYAIVGNTPSSICPASSQTGRYCIDVPLLEGSQQVLVYARHPKLGLIGPETVNVVYDPGCADQPTAPPPQTGSDEKNVAVHAPITSMNEPDINPRTYANDGKDTWTKWSKFEYGPSKDWMWVMLSLDSPHRIEKINIKWRDSKGVGEQYATDYVLLYTDQENPGAPNPANGIWQEREVVGGDGGLDPFPIGGDIVRHVALWMFQDASPVIEGYEHYAISEIEVWTKKNGLINSNQPSTDSGQTCSTIGSGY